MTTIAISTYTDPVDASNQTVIALTGTTNVSTNTVAVVVEDEDGTTIGPTAATVVGTAWSVSGIDVTTLTDGLLTYTATATALDTSQAFAAAATRKNTTTDYITVAELRAYIHDTSSNDAGPMAAAVSAASRSVESYCGRVFWSATETNYFDTDDCYYRLDLTGKDLASTSGLTVTLDTGYNGTYSTTWTLNTHFQVLPKNPATGWPWTELRALDGNVWPTSVEYRTGLVKVVGTFGWSSVPVPIQQATRVLAAQFYKMGDAALGVAGFGEFGVVRVRDNPIAAELLAPYARGSFITTA